jgi:SAM-dependent methyltransferase
MTTASFRTYSGTAAECYERYFVPVIGRPAADGLIAVADPQPGERVLDVACRTGIVARLAADAVGAGGQVAGVDIAPEMIDVARAAPAPAAPAIDWRVGDAASLPFADGSFDLVTCQMGLMFVPDRGAAVAEMRRVLAPGGRVAITTPGRIPPPFEAMERAIVAHIDPGLGGFVRAVFSMDDPDVHAGLLRDAGLADVVAREVSARLVLPAPAEFLWQYISLTPLGAFVAPAPEAAKAAMERDVVEAWQPYVVDGRVPIEQAIVVATASA